MKRRLLLSPENGDFAILPTPVYLEKENIIRVFYGASLPHGSGDGECDICYVDFDADNVTLISNKVTKILDKGAPGHFDCHGVNPSSVVKWAGGWLIYYVGYQRTHGATPFMLWPGVAMFDNDWNLIKRSMAPIINRSEFNPYSCGAPFVIDHEGKFKMWFWSGRKWFHDIKTQMKCNIAYAESLDGVNWEIKKLDVIPYHSNDNPTWVTSCARPWIIVEDHKSVMNDNVFPIYNMWFCRRSSQFGYRDIIHAINTEDGVKNWLFSNDNAILKPRYSSFDLFDNKNVCYPAVIDVKGKRYMFYNGNDNGKTGFGVVELPI